MRVLWAAVAMTAVAFACEPPPPACDATCVQLQRDEAESRQEAEETHRQLLAAQAELERENAEAAAIEQNARAQQTQNDATYLPEINAKRAQLGLPPLSHFSADPGAGAPDGAPLIFGGIDHKTYLGCICDKAEPDSIFNASGLYGPGSTFSQASIWNHYGDFGSTYGDTSLCSLAAQHPPVVVTKEGQFIGVLTVQRFAEHAIDEANVVQWLDSFCSRQD